ncbi:type I polyketide synthase [Streptomyces sp. NPDC052396]|uniref:type I polyketide synthase n=1 Tax=Streptomyces sp. NPDC052396 TaxID=3365689 RepID=UPI0037CCF471
MAGEPIAICGMSCRLPGGIRTPDELWELLAAGRHEASGLPDDRGWDLRTLCHPDPTRPGASPVRMGGFVRDIAQFDPAFFGIGPREALGMDPQQRLALEVAWEAVEHARLAPLSLRGSRTGVYVGVFEGGYLTGHTTDPAVPDITPGGRVQLFMGNTLSVVAGRIAYCLGLCGPALAVDTACSSSLTALHLAVQALRSGDCETAIAAGVTVMSSPAALIALGAAGAMARDGRSKAFGAEADGFCPSEGATALLLMPLERAHRLRHPVLAVIRGSALNEDGTGEGLAIPHGPAQEAVIGAALYDAGLGPGDVDLIEAHGTGTVVGDPVEGASLLAAYGSAHTPQRPAWLGSVKSNIGHTQAAAGISGVIKAVLALQHERMPATLHVERPTPHVDWSSGRLRLLERSRPWPRGELPRRAGVLSYGISGTNAHVILEEAPAPRNLRPTRGSDGHGPSVTPWLLSARSPVALRNQAARLAAYVRSRPELGLADVGWSLKATRSVFDHRAAVVATDRQGLLAGLDELAAGRRHPAAVTGRAPAGGPPRTVFVFPGQGAQWPGMAAGLLGHFPAFDEAMDRCARALRPFIDWDLHQVVSGAPGAADLERVDVVQPALFAMYVSLAALWRAHGVRPDAVIGHSQGEIAAAHCAGALSLQDAAKVAALRSRALRAVAGQGGMAAVALPVDHVHTLLTRWPGRLEVAVDNGPSSTTVAGERTALEELLTHCETEGLWARRLPVNYASHTALMETVRDEVLADLAGIAPRPAEIPLYSTVTGQVIDMAALDEAYWYRSLRNPVRFREAAVQALSAGFGMCIEVSPRPVLAPVLTELCERSESPATVVTTRHSDDATPEGVVRALATAGAQGAEVDLSPYWRGGREVDLSTYAFDRQRFWVPRPRRHDVESAGMRRAGHPLLVAETEQANTGTLVLSARLGLDEHPWLADHAVHDTVVVPMTAVIEYAIASADRVGCEVVENLSLHAPLILDDEEDLLLQITVAPPDSSGTHLWQLHARPADAPPEHPWTCHADARLHPADRKTDNAPGETTTWPPEPTRPVPLDDVYDDLWKRGYQYGPAFRNLRQLHLSETTCYTEARLDEPFGSDAAGFGIHPALLDAALHGVLAARTDTPLQLPCVIGSVQLLLSGAGHVRATVTSSGTDRIDALITDTDGRTVAVIKELVSLPATPQHLRAALSGTTTLGHLLSWQPQPPSSLEDAPRNLVVIGPPHEPALAPARYPDVAALSAAVAGGTPPPDVALIDHRPVTPPPHDDIDDLHRRIRQLTAQAQQFLSDPRLAHTRVLVVTQGAQGTAVTDTVPDPAGAAAWGLIRSAGLEYPGRLALLDLDDHPDSLCALPAAAATVTEQAALRHGTLLTPRLTAVNPRDALQLPADGKPWRLAPDGSNTPDGVRIVSTPEASVPLGPGQVRVRVCAAGVNFRDLFVLLGVVPEPFGCEFAGVVTEVGDAVTSLEPGHHVMGLSTSGAFASSIVADARMVVPYPRHWSFERAASTPVAFSTACHALHQLAALQPGERVLIHSAASGTGLAAAKLAAAMGAEIYATASPHKWPVLRSLGIPEERIAPSRGTAFEHRIRAVAGSRGIDVILGSLAGEAIDASMRLLAPGGRYVEMGHTDVRDDTAMAERYPGLSYHVVGKADSEDLERYMSTLMASLSLGVTTVKENDSTLDLPLIIRDMRQLGHVMGQFKLGQHTGKFVLTPPRTLNPDGTVLITGGTGTLGALLARHLVTTHGIRHLLLLSRSGPDAPGARELTAELTDLGAHPRIESCDAADPKALADTLAGVPHAHPLTAVIHAAGVLDDHAFEALTPEHLDTVLRAKADAALHLHRQTLGLDLDAFVLYSSLTGPLGSPGQANYAAANAYLDALAHHRNALGLPAVSIAWGLWAPVSKLTARIDDLSRARLSRFGLRPFTARNGLAAFDAALRLGEPHLIAAAIDRDRLHVHAENLPGLLRSLTRRTLRPRAQADTGDSTEVLTRLRALPPTERPQAVLVLVQTHSAAVLGYPTPDSIDPDRSFRDMGFDSLNAVELRSRLQLTAGLPLDPTAALNNPTPRALAHHLSEAIAAGDTAQGEPTDEVAPVTAPPEPTPTRPEGQQ